jgi:hypothetical protein
MPVNRQPSWIAYVGFQLLLGQNDIAPPAPARRQAGDRPWRGIEQKCRITRVHHVGKANLGYPRYEAFHEEGSERMELRIGYIGLPELVGIACAGDVGGSAPRVSMTPWS